MKFMNFTIPELIIPLLICTNTLVIIGLLTVLQSIILMTRSQHTLEKTKHCLNEGSISF
jgi:hypothetical protein